MRILVDESLPARLATRLIDEGHEAVHVSDIDLRSAPDPVIFQAAQRRGEVVITKDLGFGALAWFNDEPHQGVVILRFLDDEITMQDQIDETASRLRAVTEDDIKGNVVVIERDKIRIRRTPS